MRLRQVVQGIAYSHQRREISSAQPVQVLPHQEITELLLPTGQAITKDGLLQNQQGINALFRGIMFLCVLF